MQINLIDGTSGAKALRVSGANVAAEAATHKPASKLPLVERETPALVERRFKRRGSIEMARYQLRWRTEPGLRGLSCSDFQAMAIPAGGAADSERGVAVEFASDAERDAFLRQLEQYFAPQRFSNNAAAFETVKAYVLAAAKKD